MKMSSQATWQPVATCPTNTWVRTRRDGEVGENVCTLHRVVQITPDGPLVDDNEWIERDTGVTTVTHSTFAAPTHWCSLEEFCCGLVFDKDDPDHVVLIRKNHPPEQSGRLNGPGGRVRADESPHEAMCREFREETGLDVQRWQPLARIEHLAWSVHFFQASHSLNKVRLGRESLTSEAVTVRTVNKVLDDPALISDLRWLLPLALDDSVIKPLRIRVRD